MMAMTIFMGSIPRLKPGLEWPGGLMPRRANSCPRALPQGGNQTPCQLPEGAVNALVMLVLLARSQPTPGFP